MNTDGLHAYKIEIYSKIETFYIEGLFYAWDGLMQYSIEAHKSSHGPIGSGEKHRLSQIACEAIAKTYDSIIKEKIKEYYAENY